MVPSLDLIDGFYWYRSMTNQDLKQYAAWGGGLEVIKQRLQQHCHYVVVMTDLDLEEILAAYATPEEQNDMAPYRTYFESLPKVYQNEAGYVAVIQ